MYFSACVWQQHSKYWTVVSLRYGSVVVPWGVPWINASIKYGVCNLIKWFIDVLEKKKLWGVCLLLVSIYVCVCCSITTCWTLHEFPQTEMIIWEKEHADSAYEYLCSKALPSSVVNLENTEKQEEFSLPCYLSLLGSSRSKIPSHLKSNSFLTNENIRRIFFSSHLFCLHACILMKIT